MKRWDYCKVGDYDFHKNEHSAPNFQKNVLIKQSYLGLRLILYITSIEIWKMDDWHRNPKLWQKLANYSDFSNQFLHF